MQRDARLKGFKGKREVATPCLPLWLPSILQGVQQTGGFSTAASQRPHSSFLHAVKRQLHMGSSDWGFLISGPHVCKRALGYTNSSHYRAESSPWVSFVFFWVPSLRIQPSRTCSGDLISTLFPLLSALLFKYL